MRVLIAMLVALALPLAEVAAEELATRSSKDHDRGARGVHDSGNEVSLTAAINPPPAPRS